LTLTSTATLEIALGDDSERGVSYTGIALAGDGNLILDGTLVLRLTDTFSLTLGETADYQLFSIGTGSISGDFDLYTLPETWGGFDLVWDMSDLAITGWASVTAVPEP